jgi:hypothetical protein
LSNKKAAVIHPSPPNRSPRCFLSPSIIFCCLLPCILPVIWAYSMLNWSVLIGDAYRIGKERLDQPAVST